MRILITQTFKRSAKRLYRNQIKHVEEAIKLIQENPEIGELKVGDLSGIRVYKFQLLRQLILLAYSYDKKKDELALLSFAPHQNFYDNLKKQIKSLQTINL